MNKRHIRIISVLALLLLGGGYFGSPYWSSSRLLAAARSGDADRLEERIDFPSVRESLKAYANAEIMADAVDPGKRGNPFAGIGAMIAPAIIDRAVDAMITPEGIARMIAAGGTEESGEVPRNVDYSYDWLSFDRFRIALKKKDTDEKGPTFVMERRGVFSWKLVKMTPPPTKPPKAERAASVGDSVTPAVPDTSIPPAVESASNFSPSEMVLIEKAKDAYSSMRNDGGDAAYDAHTKALDQLEKTGICWGKLEEPEAAHDFHRCSSQSLQKQPAPAVGSDAELCQQGDHDACLRL